MPITRVADSSNNVDSASSMSLAVPIGTVDGDLILFFGSCDGSGYDLISGFSVIDTVTLTDHRNRLDYRVASSEPANYTVDTIAAANERGIGIFVTIRGQKIGDKSQFLDQLVLSSGFGVSSSSVVITPTLDNEIVMAFIGTNNGNNANPFMGTNTTSLIKQLDNVNGPPGTGSGSAAGGYLDEIQTIATFVGGAVNLLNSLTDVGGITVSIKEEPDVVPGGGTISNTVRNTIRNLVVNTIN